MNANSWPKCPAAVHNAILEVSLDLRESLIMAQPPSNFSQLIDFLSYLATVKGDLSNITAPPFVLSAKSVTEIPASWAERHDLFLQPSQEEDPSRRALLVLKNYLCSLKRQTYSATSGTLCDGAKKPLNAFLGELFLGTFEARDGSRTQLISEQVSHHPPVTACFIYNKKHGMSSTGYVAQETSFSPTGGVRVKQTGHGLIRDECHQESHLMTLPALAVKGLLTRNPYPELKGTCYICSSSGYLATIEFECKKGLGLGKKNGVAATITNVRDSGKVVFRISGQWSSQLRIEDCTTAKLLEEFDVDSVPLTALDVTPLDQQSPWESRRAWSQVSRGIVEGDTHKVSREKDIIEQAQRSMRGAEEVVGIEWPRVFFNKVEVDQEFELLAHIIPDDELASLHAEKTAGLWRFIGVAPAERLLEDGLYHFPLGPSSRVADA